MATCGNRQQGGGVPAEGAGTGVGRYSWRSATTGSIFVAHGWGWRWRRCLPSARIRNDVSITLPEAVEDDVASWLAVLYISE